MKSKKLLMAIIALVIVLVGAIVAVLFVFPKFAGNDCNHRCSVCGKCQDPDSTKTVCREKCQCINKIPVPAVEDLKVEIDGMATFTAAEGAEYVFVINDKEVMIDSVDGKYDITPYIEGTDENVIGVKGIANDRYTYGNLSNTVLVKYRDIAGESYDFDYESNTISFSARDEFIYILCVNATELPAVNGQDISQWIPEKQTVVIEMYVQGALKEHCVILNTYLPEIYRISWHDKIEDFTITADHQLQFSFMEGFRYNLYLGERLFKENVTSGSSISEELMNANLIGEHQFWLEIVPDEENHCFVEPQNIKSNILTVKCLAKPRSVTLSKHNDEFYIRIVDSNADVQGLKYKLYINGIYVGYVQSGDRISQFFEAPGPATISVAATAEGYLSSGTTEGIEVTVPDYARFHFIANNENAQISGIYNQVVTIKTTGKTSIETDIAIDLTKVDRRSALLVIKNPSDHPAGIQNLVIDVVSSTDSSKYFRFVQDAGLNGYNGHIYGGYGTNMEGSLRDNIGLIDVTYGQVLDYSTYWTGFALGTLPGDWGYEGWPSSVKTELVLLYHEGKIGYISPDYKFIPIADLTLAEGFDEEDFKEATIRIEFADPISTAKSGYQNSTHSLQFYGTGDNYARKWLDAVGIDLLSVEATPTGGVYANLKVYGQDAVKSTHEWEPRMVGSYKEKVTINGESVPLDFQYTGVVNRIHISFDNPQATILLEDAKAVKAKLCITIPAGSTMGYEDEGYWVFNNTIQICSNYVNGQLQWQVCTHGGHNDVLPKNMGMDARYVHDQNDFGFYVDMNPHSQGTIYSDDHNWPYMVGTYQGNITLNGEKTNVLIQYPDVANRIFLALDPQTQAILANAQAAKATLYITIPAGCTMGFADGQSWNFDKDISFCTVYNEEGKLLWQVCEHEHEPGLPEMDIDPQISLKAIANFGDDHLTLDFNVLGQDAIYHQGPEWVYMSGTLLDNLKLNGTTVSVQVQYPDVLNRLYLIFDSQTQKAIVTAKTTQATLYVTIPAQSTIAFENATWTFDKDLTVCNVFDDAGNMGWQVCTHSHTEALPENKGMDLANVGDALDSGFYITLSPRGQSNVIGAEWAHMEGTFKNWITLNGKAVQMDVQYAGPANRLFLSYSDNMQEIIASAKESKETLYITLPANSRLGFVDGSDMWIFDKRIVICNTYDEAGNMDWKICDHGSHTENVPQDQGIKLNYIHEQNTERNGLKLHLIAENVGAVKGTTMGWPVMGGNWSTMITLNGQPTSLNIKWPDAENFIYIDLFDTAILNDAKANKKTLFLTIPQGTTLELDGNTWTFNEEQRLCNIFNENGTMDWKVCDHESHTVEEPEIQGIKLNYIHEQNTERNGLKLHLIAENVGAVKGTTMGWPVMGGNWSTMITLNGQPTSVNIKWPDAENFIYLDLLDTAVLNDAKANKKTLFLTIPQGTTLELDGNTWTFNEEQRLCNVFNENGTMDWKVCDHESHTVEEPEIQGIKLNYIHEQNAARNGLKLHLIAENVGAVKGTTMGWPVMGGNWSTMITLNGQPTSVNIKWPDAENFIYLDLFDTAVLNDAKANKTTLFLTIPQGTTLELDGNTWTFNEEQRICNVFNADGTMDWKVCDHESHTVEEPEIQGIRLNYIHEQNAARNGLKLHLIAENVGAVKGTTMGWPVMGGNWSTMITLNGQPTSVNIKWPDAENFIYLDLFDTAVLNDAKANKTTLFLTIPQGTTLELDGNTWTFNEEQRICNVFNADGTMDWKVCDHEGHEVPVPEEKGIELHYIHEQNAAKTGMKLHLTLVNENAVKGTTNGWPAMGGNWSSMITLNGQPASINIKWPDAENFIWIDLLDSAAINDAKTNKTSLVLTIPDGTTLELDGYTWTFHKEQSICNAFDDAGNMSWQICDHESHEVPVPEEKGLELNYIHEQNAAKTGLKLHLTPVNENAVKGTTTGWPAMGGNWSTMITLNGQPTSVNIKWPDAENFIWIDLLDAAAINDAKANKTTLFLTIPQGTTLELDGYTWTFYTEQSICNVFDDAGNMSWQICEHESHEVPVLEEKGIELHYIHEQNAARTGIKLHLTPVNEKAVKGTTMGWPAMGGNWSTMITLNGQPTSLNIKWTDVENFIWIDLFDSATVNTAKQNKTLLVLTIPKGTTLELDGYTWTFYKEQRICNTFDGAGNMNWQVCSHTHTETASESKGILRLLVKPLTVVPTLFRRLQGKVM